MKGAFNGLICTNVLLLTDIVLNQISCRLLRKVSIVSRERKVKSEKITPNF